VGADQLSFAGEQQPFGPKRDGRETRETTAMDAAGGQGLVPTKFVWRLGGSHVFLCGSFTRWVETVRVCGVGACSNPGVCCW
jgi:hypothetical protein